jgi:parallel beta-helix repeat protein
MLQANNTRVFENTINCQRGSYETGIGINGGHDSDVFHNDIGRVGYGIYLQGAVGYNVSFNTIADSRYGFGFAWSSSWGDVPSGQSYDCDIIGNSFDKGGLYPVIDNFENWDFNSIRFEDNTVNGRPIGFIHSLTHDSIDGSSYGQLFLLSCQDVEILEGDFDGIYSGRTVGSYYDYGNAAAVTLLNCTRCSLNNVTFFNNTIGVNFQYSQSCTLFGGAGLDQAWAAVIIWNSEAIDIVDVELVANLKGIAVGSSYGCVINDCSIWTNDEAVNLVNSYNITLSQNRLNHNTYAIFLGDADGCLLKGNSIYSNARGILLNSSSECLIVENSVHDNTGVGIVLDATSNRNEIYNNTFANNNPNAICEGSSNHWDNQVDTGNRWSDYNGTGPYIIDENDRDNFPFYDYATTTPSTTPTTSEPWQVDPLLLGIAGGVVGIVVLVIIIIDRRRIVIVD